MTSRGPFRPKTFYDSISFLLGMVCFKSLFQVFLLTLKPSKSCTSPLLIARRQVLPQLSLPAMGQGEELTAERNVVGGVSGKAMVAGMECVGLLCFPSTPCVYLWLSLLLFTLVQLFLWV